MNQKGLEYMMGWWETHPEEFPTSYEEFLIALEQGEQLELNK